MIATEAWCISNEEFYEGMKIARPIGTTNKFYRKFCMIAIQKISDLPNSRWIRLVHEGIRTNSSMMRKDVYNSSTINNR